MKKINIQLIILLTAVQIFGSYSWGKYLFLAIALLIFATNVLNTKGCFCISCDAYFGFNMLFILFTLCTSLWAYQPLESIIAARTLFRNFLFVYIVYIVLCNIKSLDVIVILQSVMWSGYIAALYALIYYGLDTLLLAGTSTSFRLENTYANVNTIGLACALSCVIHINLVAMKKKKLLSPAIVFFVIAIIVITATQSRKAFVYIALGSLGALFVAVQNNGISVWKKVGKVLLGVIVCVIGVSLILQMDAFSGITQRMTYYINSITGVGKVDNSALIRAAMVEQGMITFFQHPMGIGMANAHIVAANKIGIDVYLHNNFVELLCGGGVIAFGLYYGMYIYLFWNLWNYRKINKQRTMFFVLWLGLMLMMNYGLVTYQSKSQSIYLMIHFVNVLDLRRIAQGKTNIQENL